MNNKKKGFTLLEILVVVGIIALFAGTGLVSFTSLNKSSRDAKRKGDLENIRAALEMYRSNNNVYPISGTGVGAVDTSCTATSGLTDTSGNTYLTKIPKDPKCPTTKYYYAPVDSGGGGCDNSPTDLCVNYTLATQFELTSSCISSPPANSCGTGFSCNYCLGPLGEK